jgi:purine-binding chemotaxis protein CheW
VGEIVVSDGQLTADAVRRILEERARHLARAADDGPAGATVPLVELAVGPERVAVPLGHVQEIQPLKGLTPVPGAGPYWAGVVNLRGQLYPVLDLRPYLRLPADGPPDGGHIVVVAGAGFKAALWAGDVHGLRELPPEQLQAPPLAADGAPGVVAGVTADLLTVLDLDALLADPRLLLQEEAG